MSDKNTADITKSKSKLNDSTNKSTDIHQNINQQN
jgi:hypothetical protein